MTKTTDALIIGAGQAGLAMSVCLSALGIEHLVLDRGAVGERWRSERWPSLKLLTPNWMTRLPGHTYDGPDPHGFMGKDDVVRMLARYARENSVPVQEFTTVEAIHPSGRAYRVKTSRGLIRARAVVLATGAFDTPSVPAFAANLSPRIAQITPADYIGPDALAPDGVLVVGASATGAQFADEIARSGRQVRLAVGTHTRIPRRYRGRDFTEWLTASGATATPRDPTQSDAEIFAKPSSMLIGCTSGRNIDLMALRKVGVRPIGRLTGIEGTTARFADTLNAEIDASEARREAMLAAIDAHIEAGGVKAHAALYQSPPWRPKKPGPTSLDLIKDGIRTVIWATGFRRDYSWLHVPTLTAEGELRHSGGVTEAPGLYALGLPEMRRQGSAYIDGVGQDAREIADHLAAHLRMPGAIAAE